MAGNRVLFLDRVHPVLQQELEGMDYRCEMSAEADRQKIIPMICKSCGIVVRSRITLDREALEKAVNLKFIARAGSGMENIDVQFAESRGIACINAPEGNKDAVAEHALGMLLALLNKITLADRAMRKGRWERERNRGRELGGKTVGIIGYGNAGSAFAKRLSGFDVNLVIYDKFIEEYSGTLATLFDEADIVSVHVPLTEATTYMIDHKFISKFRKNIYIINTSRGQVLNTEDLVSAIQTGKVLGACLDVLEHERSSFEDLSGAGFWFNKRGVWWNNIGIWLNKTGIWKYAHAITYLTRSSKVILTPHIAGWSFESNEKIARILAEKIRMLEKR